MRGPPRATAPMNALSVREAAAKYCVPPSTVSGWVAAGLVRVVSNPERRGQPKLIAEPDVARLAAAYVPGATPRLRKRLAEALAHAS